MNLTDILANYRSLARPGIGSWNFPLERIVQTLFERYIPDDLEMGYARLIGTERINAYTLLKLLHSDERSTEMHVLEIDEKPVGIVYRFGGEWNSYIADPEKYKGVCREMAVARMEQQLKDVKLEHFESLRELKPSAMFLLGAKESMFAVQSPKTLYNFDELVMERKAYFVDESLVAHPVERILDFANNKNSFNYARDLHDVRVLIAGAERVVDGSQLMFELVPGQGDVEDALTSYAKAPCWAVDLVNQQHNYAEILIRTPGRWTTDTLGCQFADDAERARFEKLYFDHSKTEQLMDGVFDAGALGFQAKVKLTY